MLEAGVQANEAWKFFAREKTYCFFFLVFPMCGACRLFFLILSVDWIFLMKLRNRIQKETAVIQETFSFGDIFDLESILYQPDFR